MYKYTHECKLPFYSYAIFRVVTETTNGSPVSLGSFMKTHIVGSHSKQEDELLTVLRRLSVAKIKHDSLTMVASKRIAD
jgi:hypothetical protein